MTKFFIAVLVGALKDEEVQKFLLVVVDRISANLLPKLSSIIPAAVGAGIKGLGDLIPDVHVPEVHEITEEIRAGINAVLPEDIDIPVLSDVFEQATGFDLTDVLTGRKHG